MPEIYQSVVFGMGFWIDNQGLFMSAPSYATGGGCDMDNAIPVYDWGKLGRTYRASSLTLSTHRTNVYT